MSCLIPPRAGRLKIFHLNSYWCFRGTNIFNSFCVIWGSEHTRSRDYRVGARIDDLVRIGTLDTAIDLNPGVESTVISHFSNGGDLWDDRVNKALASEARVDRHDENNVTQLDNVLNSARGGGWVEDDARFAAKILNEVESSVEMDGRLALAMHRNDIGTSLDKVRNEQLRLDNHEMYVERLFSDGAQGIDDEGPNGDVRDEAAVHNVDVDPVAARLVNGADFISEFGEVCGEDGGGDNDLTWLGFADDDSADNVARCGLLNADGGERGGGGLGEGARGCQGRWRRKRWCSGHGDGAEAGVSWLAAEEGGALRGWC